MTSYSATPRRKLCLDPLDDDLQSPPHDTVALSESDIRSPPFTNGNSPVLVPTSPLYSRRQLYSLILPGMENISDSGSYQSPSSLPTCTSPLLKQISSPMGRMKIESPIPPRSCCTSENSNDSDGYFSEVFDRESTLDENSNSSIPDSISTLLTKPFSEFAAEKLPPNNLSKRRTSFNACLKRPTPTDESDLPSKRVCAKRVPLADTGNYLKSSPPTSNKKSIKGTTLFRSQSISIPSRSFRDAIYPVSPGEGDGVEIIGDHSKPYVLPLMSERTNVADQMNITSETLSRLLQDDFSDLVQKYTIVDCRYPYEYQGGHIEGAINVWNKDILLEKFFTSPTHPDESTGRHIIIFHCEFSSKRGPEMSRFMRQIDRKRNGVDFPRLYYPEIYLLHGGYKDFYNSYPNHCQPQSYKCMLDKNHKGDLKHFSKRSKSWSNEGEAGRRRQPPVLRRRHSAHESEGTLIL